MFVIATPTSTFQVHLTKRNSDKGKYTHTHTVICPQIAKTSLPQEPYPSLLQVQVENYCQSILAHPV